MKAPNYDMASSCLVCGVALFDVGHRTFRRGVELFDVASNFSTWHRTFRRGVEIFDVGHRNVAGECPLTSNIPTFPHRRIHQRSHSCCASVLLGRYRKTLSGLASLFRWGALRISQDEDEDIRVRALAFLRFSEPDCQGLFCLRRHTTSFFEQNRNRPKSRPAVSGLIIKSERLF